MMKEELGEMFLSRLKDLLRESERAMPAWMEELLLHGPRLEEWPEPRMRPNRMEMTEFLARWLKYAGIGRQEALEWLLGYCCEVLSEYSQSGRSQIRHGAKYNVRYVYDGSIECDFSALEGSLPAEFEGRPPFMPVLERWREQLEEEKRRRRESYVWVPPVVLSVKERYREQFEKGLQFAREKLGAGEGLAKVLTLMNQQGFLSRTGRRWSASTLMLSLREQSAPSEPVGESSANPAMAGPSGLKALYREQFEEALKSARRQLREGVTIRRVAERLNEHGFRTRTGRAWSSRTLRQSLAQSSEPGQSPESGDSRDEKPET
jgi:hypothetical protein